MLALALAACAPRGPVRLSAEALRSRASWAFAEPFDDAFDAAWLVTEALEYQVAESDRRAGTLATRVRLEPNGSGRRLLITVATEGASTLITVLPRVFQGERDVTDEVYWTLEGEGGEERRWADFFGRVGGLFATWKRHPELSLDPARGELDAAGLKLLVPPKWEHFEFTTDRRALTVQPFKPRPGVTPTLVYRLERRHPQVVDPGLRRLALERALRGRVVEPEWKLSGGRWGLVGEGEALVGPALLATPVRWRQWEARALAWVVWVVAACATEGERVCDAEVQEVLESAADANGRLVNPGGAVSTFKAR